MVTFVGGGVLDAPRRGQDPSLQYKPLKGLQWHGCGPGMPGPYRVAMRKPDMALQLAGRMYAAPTIAGRFTTRNVGGGVAGL